MATLNFTGRSEIGRDRIQLRLREQDSKVLLDVNSIDLTGLNLPGTAKLAVEAYRQTIKVRVSCGSVAAPAYPKDVHLDAFDVIDDFQLRLRVVGSDDESHGKVLAVADRLNGGGSESAASDEPLLKMQRTELGDRIWKFGLDDDQPILYVNKRLENHDQLIHSAAFKALVLPEFFRYVASWIARNRDDADEPNSTISHWLLFCERIGIDPSGLDGLGNDDEDAPDAIDEWATEAASVFATEIGALSLLNGPTDPEEDNE